MATSFESILKHTHTTHPIHGGTNSTNYRILPDDSPGNAALQKKLDDARQELAAWKQKYAQLKAHPPASPPGGAASSTALAEAEAKLAESEAKTAESEAKLAAATAEAEAKLAAATAESEAKLAAATADSEAKLAATRVEWEQQIKERLKQFETTINKELDNIPTRRMAGGGAFQEDTILSVLGSTSEHGESARIALEAMRETLKSVGKHEDLVKRWDRTLSELDSATAARPEKQTDGDITPTATYDIPTVVGLIPTVERLLTRYEAARTNNDTRGAVLARAEFESTLLEATGVQYVLSPMAWEKNSSI